MRFREDAHDQQNDWTSPNTGRLGNRHGGAWAVGQSTGLCDRKASSENGNDMGEKLPGLGTAPENIAKRVRDMTDGQLDIQIYAAGELVSPFDVLTRYPQARQTL